VKNQKQNAQDARPVAMEFTITTITALKQNAKDAWKSLR
jgi:hypothetical protein